MNLFHAIKGILEWKKYKLLWLVRSQQFNDWLHCNWLRLLDREILMSLCSTHEIKPVPSLLLRTIFFHHSRPALIYCNHDQVIMLLLLSCGDGSAPSAFNVSLFIRLSCSTLFFPKGLARPLSLFFTFFSPRVIFVFLKYSTMNNITTSVHINRDPFILSVDVLPPRSLRFVWVQQS